MKKTKINKKIPAVIIASLAVAGAKSVGASELEMSDLLRFETYEALSKLTPTIDFTKQKARDILQRGTVTLLGC